MEKFTSPDQKSNRKNPLITIVMICDDDDGDDTKFKLNFTFSILLKTKIIEKIVIIFSRKPKALKDNKSTRKIIINKLERDEKSGKN